MVASCTVTDGRSPRRIRERITTSRNPWLRENSHTSTNGTHSRPSGPAAVKLALRLRKRRITSRRSMSADRSPGRERRGSRLRYSPDAPMAEAPARMPGDRGSDTGPHGSQCPPSPGPAFGAETAVWHLVAIAAAIAAAVVLRLYRLDEGGYGNAYYAATVKSMLTSGHNFFFGSFDPEGFVSVEKPPLGFWIQAVSAHVFGFSSWSTRLPQAIADIGSIMLLASILWRSWGGLAANVAAFVYAVSPISVAASRHNTIDSLVVFAVLAAVITTVHAAETARWRPILLAGVLLGLAFNVKLLQMILYLPSIYLLYLCSARSVSVPRRIWRLTGLTMAMVVVGMSWIVTVDLTPPEHRPYVGGTANNTARDLLLGERYPAIRILGLSPRAWLRGGAGWSLRGSTDDAWEIGEPGVLRLMTPQLAGQISWFLVLALGGAVVLMVLLGWRALLDTARGRILLFLAVDAAVQLLFFSTARFHRYYLVMLAPVMAALVGVAVQSLWESYKRGGWERWLLPGALVFTAAAQVHILQDYPAWARWYGPVLLVVCGGAALALLFAGPPRLAGRRRTAAVATSAAMGALLICPAVWAVTAIGAGGPLYLDISVCGTGAMVDRSPGPQGRGEHCQVGGLSRGRTRFRNVLRGFVVRIPRSRPDACRKSSGDGDRRVSGVGPHPHPRDARHARRAGTCTVPDRANGQSDRGGSAGARAVTGHMGRPSLRRSSLR